MSGPRIPGFTYLQHLGSGGFADVFLYEQQWPRQRVAVKVVRSAMTISEQELGLFTAEANAMARLADHPYIVDVITAGVTEPDQGSRPYLVMRYCPPPDLGARVRTEPMSVPDAISTGIKLASAVETAHRAGIIHRDIKPSNVLVTSYQEPALTDFGIAGHLAEVEHDQEVRISYPWAPPEMVDGRSNGSIASDVYSLGATIWNLLTGRSPYAIPGGDNSARSLTTRVLHATPPSLQRPDAPPALDRLLQLCLAKQPELRPQSALEVARELQRIESASGYARTPVAVAGDRATVTPTTPDPGDDVTALKPVTVEAAAPPPAAGQVVAAEPPPPVRRGAAAAAGVAILALVVLGVVLVTTLGGSEREPAPELTPDPSFTPSDVVPEASLPQPSIVGRRDGQQVTFRWRVVGGTRPGDTWVWRRVDTGASDRVESRELTVNAPARVCLQVQLVRGDQQSPSEQTCVG